MPKLTVTDTTGKTATLDARTGLSVMETLRSNGYPVVGECEGSLACATCHVIVDPAWADRLPEISEKEEDMLDTVFDLTATSRLCCQIIMGDQLDGLAVSLPTT
ncbi:MAG: 2Fe-2S ferredoxin [Rhodospirillaceae bacterium BRH_c57]|nr:MAG: 2Fe-2S ferredoxin [Rhodospirillaceae bacterium BRH_c57]